MRGKLIIFDSVFQFFHWKTVAFYAILYQNICRLFLQNYCVLLQGVYNIIVDNTGAAAPGWRNTDMTKQEMLQLKMTATRVRMGIIEATHGGKSGTRAAAFLLLMC